MHKDLGRKEAEWEYSVLNSLLQDYKEEITNVRNAYQLLVRIVEVASLIFPQINSQLNEYYISLIKLIEHNVFKLNRGMDKYCQPQGKEVFPEIGFGYMEPYVFDKIFYKPFPNFYNLKAEDVNVDWDLIKKQMSDSVAQIEEVWLNNHLPEGAVTNAQNLFNTTEDYLNKKATKNQLEGQLGKLKLYEKNGKVEYTAHSGNEYCTNLGTNTNQFILLKYLVHNQDKKCSHEELAKGLKLPRNNSNNPTEEQRVRDTVQSIRKKLKLLPEDDFFIVDYGYGLKCNVELSK